MKKRVGFFAFIGILGSVLVPARASAAAFDLANLIPNIGFESGLAGWTYSGACVNANTYLTNAEWTAQSWSSSSPYAGYTDAQLAIYYPGQPWGLTPDITHVQQTGGPLDPGGVINAAVGTNFVGSRQDGYAGHYLTGGAPEPPTAFYDTNFQLRIDLAQSFSIGDTFSLTVWGNRGRLRDDYGAINGSSELTFRLIGEAGASDFNVLCTFTAWGVDGAWASQPCNWVLDRNVTSLRLQVTGQNHNHDRYVAVDMGSLAVVPEPSSMLLLGSGLVGLAAVVRRRRRALA